jgi:hypothetical protein
LESSEEWDAKVNGISARAYKRTSLVAKQELSTKRFFVEERPGTYPPLIDYLTYLLGVNERFSKPQLQFSAYVAAPSSN